MCVLMPYLQFLRDTFLHLLAKELGIENIDSNLDKPTLTYLSDAEKRKFIIGLSVRVVENCTNIGDAILGNKFVEESGDKNMIMHRHFVIMLFLLSSSMMPGVRVMGYA